MISRQERIVSMAFLTTPLPENIDEDCEDCQHWIENHSTIYDDFVNAYDAQQYWIDAGYYDVQKEEYTSGDYINSRRRI